MQIPIAQLDLERQGAAALLQGFVQARAYLDGVITQLQAVLTGGVIDQRGRAKKTMGALVAEVEQVKALIPAPVKRAYNKRVPDVAVRTGKPIDHPYWSKLSPEERKAEMTRRQAVARSKRDGNAEIQRAKIGPTPDRVGKFVTLASLQKPLGVTTRNSVLTIARRIGIEPKMVGHPTKRGSLISVVTETQAARIVKSHQNHRGLKPSPKPAATAGHPRNADHPKHAEYVAKLKKAAQRRVEKMGGKAAYAKYMKTYVNGAIKESAA